MATAEVEDKAAAGGEQNAAPAIRVVVLPSHRYRSPPSKEFAVVIPLTGVTAAGGTCSRDPEIGIRQPAGSRTSERRGETAGPSGIRSSDPVGRKVPGRARPRVRQRVYDEPLHLPATGSCKLRAKEPKSIPPAVTTASRARAAGRGRRPLRNIDRLMPE